MPPGCISETGSSVQIIEEEESRGTMRQQHDNIAIAMDRIFKNLHFEKPGPKYKALQTTRPSPVGLGNDDDIIKALHSQNRLIMLSIIGRSGMLSERQPIMTPVCYGGRVREKHR
jgi:hypothetical protein